MSGCTSCSHSHEAHEHYRAGTDCGLCDCVSYRRNPLTLAKRALHRDVAGVTVLVPAPTPDEPVVAA